MQEAAYISLMRRGLLRERVELLFSLLAPCRLCPWRCMVDRLRGETGRCKAGSTIRIAKAIAHFGEEPPISGTSGSGALFFSHCNLSCCFCQNYQISHEGQGIDITPAVLADLMLMLQQQGCHTINLVSPTHYLPFIMAGLERAARSGLHLPLVYNSNGYELPEVLRLLEGVVDVYLPDMKYADDAAAQTFSGARDYTAINLAAVDEMMQQAGYLLLAAHGIAQRGVIIRHLVLPAGVSGTNRVLTTIRNRYGRFAAVSLMAQYTPCYHAHRFPELTRRISREEYDSAVATVASLGFEYGWIQEYDSLDNSFFPDFRKKKTWN